MRDTKTKRVYDAIRAGCATRSALAKHMVNVDIDPILFALRKRGLIVSQHTDAKTVFGRHRVTYTVCIDQPYPASRYAAGAKRGPRTRDVPAWVPRTGRGHSRIRHSLAKEFEQIKQQVKRLESMGFVVTWPEENNREADQ